MAVCKPATFESGDLFTVKGKRFALNVDENPAFPFNQPDVGSYSSFLQAVHKVAVFGEVELHGVLFLKLKHSLTSGKNTGT